MWNSHTAGGQKVGIHLGHAGRKASTVAPWLSSRDTATEEVYWHAVNVPSNVLRRDRSTAGPTMFMQRAPFAHSEKLPHPKEMTKADIENVKKAWVASVERALACGFDVIEIHNAQ